MVKHPPLYVISKHPIFRRALLGILVTLLLVALTPVHDVTVLVPQAPDLVAYDEGKLLVLSAAKSIGEELLVSRQWKVERLINITSKPAKEGFAKEFYKLFDPETSIESVTYAFQFQAGFGKPESLHFRYTDTMTVRAFWKQPQFAELLKVVKTTSAGAILLQITGWKDSIYTTLFEDPENESRLLYKLNLRLVEGENNLYFGPPGNKTKAMLWSTSVVTENRPVEDRRGRFHNSPLEGSCSTCHEGLPSQTDGREMNADCSSCHKAISSGIRVHGPVEMKECGSCHGWSTEKNAVIVSKGVPETCFDCHSDMKEIVETSTVQHAVASDCGTCHAPHSTGQPSLLKKDVYALCISCHEAFGTNHPVNNHPVRFAMLEKSGREISCVDCHSPHGSPNASLLKASGGRMGSCMGCHQ